MTNKNLLFSMQSWQENSYLEAENAPYLEALYHDYCQGKPIVDARILSYFQSIAPQVIEEANHAAVIQALRDSIEQPRNTSTPLSENNTLLALIDACRRHGHRAAQLDPLNLTTPPGHETLSLDYFGLQSDAEAARIFEKYKKIYCQHIGYEFMYIEDSGEVAWLEHQIEKQQGDFEISLEKKKEIFAALTAAEGLEKFLGRRYVGKTRFSIEGLEGLIPALHEIICQAACAATEEVVIGMAHRGRLNVMVNVLGMQPSALVDYMDSKQIDTQYAGDVVYHLGFSSQMTANNRDMLLSMPFNPSHLEIISPVVMGTVRARQQSSVHALSILLHGDAAFSGQGVVMEALAMSQTRGYGVGGTIHLVTNNQIGFTTNQPQDARSSLYCSDSAKMISAPIFHVNADDPEAIIFVTRLACAYREKFKKDVVIDLVGYRRYGHNEADEPAATQPVLYRTIKAHPTVRMRYAEQLQRDHILNATEIEKIFMEYQQQLDAGDSPQSLRAAVVKYQAPALWSGYAAQPWHAHYTSAISAQNFAVYAQKLLTLPENFTAQTQVKRTLLAREKAVQEGSGIDWGMAENLAYASLLAENYSVRLSGEDVCRGTFAHRHSVIHDQATGETYTPLTTFASGKTALHIIDSLLSEEAVMAFEYGYAITDPNTLVIWEAQYGDFVNGAQVVIDQFLSSGEQKWQQLCGLVLLLPHGFEGAGPEHSSARLERFLQLCAQENLQVCVPSTPAQIFHLLRRQMLRPYRKPLIVFTPKSILRHKLAVSVLTDFTHSHFQLVITQPSQAKAQRVILCAGKIYYDLLSAQLESQVDAVTLIRIEQLYPFPTEAIVTALEPYTAVADIVWCQEEPKNQGAWVYVREALSTCLRHPQRLTYVGRPESASPATGFSKVHTAEQTALIKNALNLS